MSDAVLDGDYPITGIQTTTKITEQMIQESYGAAVAWIRNADVPTYLSDEQLQAFLRKFAELCGKAEQADAAIAATGQVSRRQELILVLFYVSFIFISLVYFRVIIACAA